MPRMTPVELCIANLRGAFPEQAVGYQPIEEAIEELKDRTGQDFGSDVSKWESWLVENPEVVSEKAKDLRDARKLARGMKPKP
jgi:hypothetical protein